MEQMPPTPGSTGDDSVRETVQGPAPVVSPTESSAGGGSWFRRHRRATAICAIAAAGLLLGGGTTAAAVVLQQRATDARYAAPSRGFGNEGGYRAGGSWAQGGTTTPSATSSGTTATAAQEKGLVVITTTVDYGEGEAAGTGMILTSSGQVLTNNHVVEGATSITVTVETTGKSYTASVVGTDSTDDVALLQLSGASGLSTVSIDDDGGAAVGDAVTDVGNAEGTGTLVAASGTITATDQQIQVSDDETGATKTLNGLLETNADVVSGDSGGPLLDSAGEVVGMATAASSGSSDVTGYAIPIENALAVIKQIRTGEATSTLTIGLPAFLGVQLSSTGSTGTGVATTGSGVEVAGTVSGSAAESAGLVAGDVITAIDGTAVVDSDALSAAIAAHKPGDQVTVSYTDAQGAAQTVTVTLGEGPAA